MATPPKTPPLSPEVAPEEMVADPIVIGLKRLYNSVLTEPVPDDFLNLLERIDASLADISDATPETPTQKRNKPNDGDT